jgi:hypothetical protein
MSIHVQRQTYHEFLGGESVAFNRQDHMPSKPKCPPSRVDENPNPSLFEETMIDALGSPHDRSAHSNLYLGRAGEFFVASELLRRGLNPYLAPVDTGIDLVAHREFTTPVPLLNAVHDVFLFQIKTTSIDEYKDSINTHTVHKWLYKRINLVIVFWPENTQPTCLVLPPSLLFMLTSGGFDDHRSPLKIGPKKVQLRVLRQGNRFFLRNRKNEVTAMWDRFDRIEPINSISNMPSYASWSNGKGLLEIEE